MPSIVQGRDFHWECIVYSSHIIHKPQYWHKPKYNSFYLCLHYGWSAKCICVKSCKFCVIPEDFFPIYVALCIFCWCYHYLLSKVTKSYTYSSPKAFSSTSDVKVACFLLLEFKCYDIFASLHSRNNQDYYLAPST